MPLFVYPSSGYAINILMFSICGDGIGLAHQLASEGHQVVAHFVDDLYGEQGKGMILHSSDWQASAREVDYVIFDGNGKGVYADNLRKDGVKVWCGGYIADRLENDRSFGAKVFEKAGIPHPETWHFSSASEAKAILSENFKPAERSVVKLNNASSASSYCARDRQDMEGQIEAWEKHYSAALAEGGIIQRFIEGVEISVEGWFDGEKFLYPFNWTMEDKKLLSGNLGPNVGCAFSMVRNMRARLPRIARVFLTPLEPLLKRSGYTGQIDVNCIVADDGKAYALEFTPRPGYEGTSNLVQTFPGYGVAVARALHIDDGGDMIEGGDHPFDYVAALRLYVPPYPYEAKNKPLAKQVYGAIEGTPVDFSQADDFVPYDIKMDDEFGTVLAGTCGVVGITLGRGREPKEAIDQCLKRARHVEVPNLSYRSDAGARVIKELPEIESMGWLR